MSVVSGSSWEYVLDITYILGKTQYTAALLGPSNILSD